MASTSQTLFQPFVKFTAKAITGSLLLVGSSHGDSFDIYPCSCLAETVPQQEENRGHRQRAWIRRHHPLAHLKQFIYRSSNPAKDIDIPVIGGHGGMMRQGQHVLKPVDDRARGQREIAFYMELNQQCPPTEYPATVIPRFHGIRSKIENGKQQKYLELEDLTRNFRKPCIIDIKVGKRTWDLAATAEKKERQIRRYPPQLVSGFRIVGMHLFRPFEGEDGTVISTDRKFGRSLQENDIHLGLLEYLYDGRRVRTEVLMPLIQQLKSLRDWFETQSEYRFVSSSLLIIFEGDPSFDEPAVKVSMIDFAHTFPMKVWSDSHSSDQVNMDTDYILGLTNLISALERLHLTFAKDESTRYIPVPLDGSDR